MCRIKEIRPSGLAVGGCCLIQTSGTGRSSKKLWMMKRKRNDKGYLKPVKTLDDEAEQQDPDEVAHKVTVNVTVTLLHCQVSVTRNTDSDKIYIINRTAIL
jgi:hypothetical protein